jgi:antitoxin component of MazEF toxin-antitoxin module
MKQRALRATVRRSGSSLIVTIPKAEVERLGLREGDLVSLDIQPMDVVPALRPELRRHADASWEHNQEAHRYLAGR